jgi:hypothetical protein
LIRGSDFVSSSLLEHHWRQFDFEWRSLFQCGKQPRGLLWIVEHRRHPFRNRAWPLGNHSPQTQEHRLVF